MLNLLFSFIHNTDLRGTESVEVTPQFVSPIWELVSERNDTDDVNKVGGNGEGSVGASEVEGGRGGDKEGKRVMEGKEGKDGGEERKGERKGDSKEEKGTRGQGRNITQLLPSASYAQSFQGF